MTAHRTTCDICHRTFAPDAGETVCVDCNAEDSVRIVGLDSPDARYGFMAEAAARIRHRGNRTAREAQLDRIAAQHGTR